MEESLSHHPGTRRVLFHYETNDPSKTLHASSGKPPGLKLKGV